MNRSVRATGRLNSVGNLGGSQVYPEDLLYDDAKVSAPWYKIRQRLDAEATSPAHSKAGTVESDARAAEQQRDFDVDMLEALQAVRQKSGVSSHSQHRSPRRYCRFHCCRCWQVYHLDDYLAEKPLADATPFRKWKWYTVSLNLGVGAGTKRLHSLRSLIVPLASMPSHWRAVPNGA